MVVLIRGSLWGLYIQLGNKFLLVVQHVHVGMRAELSCSFFLLSNSKCDTVLISIFMSGNVGKNVEGSYFSSTYWDFLCK